MSLFARFFKRPAPVSTLPLRDTDGKFIPHKLAVRSRALWLAEQMGRADLIQRLSGADNFSRDRSEIRLSPPNGSGLEFVAPVSSFELPPAPPETADATSAKPHHPRGTSAVAGHGKALRGANGVDVATFNFGAMQ
jgi:hypothetical protein